MAFPLCLEDDEYTEFVAYQIDGGKRYEVVRCPVCQLTWRKPLDMTVELDSSPSHEQQTAAGVPR